MVELYYNNTDTNKIIIPWSGGVDSTAIVFKLIEMYEKDEICLLDKQIHLVSINIQHNNIGEIESKRRKKILSYIKKKHKKFYDKIVYNQKDESVAAYDVKSDDNYQPYYWITEIFRKYGSYFTLLLGYHKGDSFWTVFPEFQKLIDASEAYFSKQTNRYIYYPLAFMYKDEIYEMLPDKIKKLVWWCETPKKNKPCRKCLSCKTHYRFIKGKK